MKSTFSIQAVRTRDTRIIPLGVDPPILREEDAYAGGAPLEELERDFPAMGPAEAAKSISVVISRWEIPNLSIPLDTKFFYAYH